MFPSILFSSNPVLSDVVDADSTTLSDFRYQWAVEGGVAPGRVLALNELMKRVVKSSSSTSVYLQANRTAPVGVGTDEDVDYNWPTLSMGLRMNFNHGTTMHRESDPAWDKIQPVDYVTRLGNSLTLYGRFERPVVRRRRWEAGYYLGTGVGFFHSKYNTVDGIDNELIGSKVTIYFTAGLYGRYWLSKDWAVKGGLDFAHHSTGALNRPNKGANYLAPFASLLFSPEHELFDKSMLVARKPFRPYWLLELSFGAGGKTLLEDWSRTQFDSEPTDPDYRTSKFPVYGAFSMQTAVLYRYARRWATGLGVDVFYGDYASKVARLDREAGYVDEPHSPWSVAVAFRHEVFYGPFSARMGLGWYLFRRMGKNAKDVEKPYYERIGLFYTLPGFHGTAVGMSVNAHLGKADFTELVLSVPVTRFKIGKQ